MTERITTHTRCTGVGRSSWKRSAVMSLLQTAWMMQSFAEGLLSPTFLPEEVVQAQLKALQNLDMNTAFKFYSPLSRDAIGDLKDFEEILLKPPFGHLVGHTQADVLLVSNADEFFTMCLARIVPSEKVRKKLRSPCLYYWFELLHHMEERPDDGGCYMIESIMPDFEDINLNELDLLSLLDSSGEDSDGEIFFDLGF